jgi:hypothetical protein
MLSCPDAVTAESRSGAATGSVQSLLQVLFQFGEFPVHETDLLVKKCVREMGRLKECDHEFGTCPIGYHTRGDGPGRIGRLKIMVKNSVFRIGADTQLGEPRGRCHVPPVVITRTDCLDIDDGPLRPVLCIRQVCENTLNGCVYADGLCDGSDDHGLPPRYRNSIIRSKNKGKHVH